jgi:hypothetical protein
MVVGRGRDQPRPALQAGRPAKRSAAELVEPHRSTLRPGGVQGGQFAGGLALDPEPSVAHAQRRENALGEEPVQ